MTAPVAVTPPGHDLSRWAHRRAAADRMELADLVAELDRPDRTALLVLGAHPDDETLGLGRLIHHWARHRGPVTAVVASAGEACLDHLAARPAGLDARRLAEWVAATAILGVRENVRLDLPDGRLAQHERDLTAGIEAVLAERDATLPHPVLAAPWRHDPHPDHQAVGRAAADVGRRLGIPVLEYGVWMTYWSEPTSLDIDRRRLAVLITDDHDEQAFRQACQEFASQLLPLGPEWGPVVPPAMLAHLSEQLVVLPSKEDL